MKTTLLAAALPLALTGCVLAIGNKGTNHEGGHSHASSHRGSPARTAEAAIHPRSGSELSGRSSFEETDGGVLVDVRVEGAPSGWLAVHVHEEGDCSADDAGSAGGHFAPDGRPHGLVFEPEHHAGDLGNMWVGENGKGRFVVWTPDLTVRPGPHSVLGRALVVHAGADDFTSQPSGAAGARIGCGVIR